ncbi:MAG: DUF2148 domain-containing protein [Elusimicrobiota bacterium]
MDFLTTAVVSGAHKRRLCRRTRAIAKRDKVDFFERDTENIEGAPVVVLLGKGVAIAYGLPLSVTGKSPFFDREKKK